MLDAIAAGHGRAPGRDRPRRGRERPGLGAGGRGGRHVRGPRGGVRLEPELSSAALPGSRRVAHVYVARRGRRARGVRGRLRRGGRLRRSTGSARCRGARGRGWPAGSCARRCSTGASAAARRRRCRPRSHGPAGLPAPRLPRARRRSTCGSADGDRRVLLESTVHAHRRDHRPARGEPVFSFEFFPPKTPEGEVTLRETLATLGDLRPSSSRSPTARAGPPAQRTVEITKWIKQELGIEAMAHLSCVGEPVERLREILDEVGAGRHRERARPARRPAARRDGVEAAPRRAGLLDRAGRADRRGLRLLHRRGVLPRGPPRGRPTWPATCASSRRRSRRARASSSRSCSSTTSCTSTSSREARAAGIDVPIVAGIMPITNVKQITTHHRDVRRDHPARRDGRARAPRRRPRRRAPVRRRLRDRSSAPTCCAAARPGIHFYTLNRSPATRAILSSLRCTGRGARRPPSSRSSGSISSAWATIGRPPDS